MRCNTRNLWAEFTSAGKFSSAYVRFIPVLALGVATVAWSQTVSDLRGPGPRPPSVSIAPLLANSSTDVPASDQHGYEFITLEIKGSPNAVANGINDDGLVTGYYQDSASTYHGFVWRDGAFETVDYPGATYTLLYGLNNRGVAIGYYFGEGAVEHTVTYCVRTRTWTALPDIPGYSVSQGYGINDEGVAVGNAFAVTGASVAWIWHPETLSYSFFTVPGAAKYTTFPSGLNNKNQVAGYFADEAYYYHGFLKEYGTYTIIDVPGATETFLDGINNRGVIQGQIYDAAGAAEGFLATPGGRFAIVNYPGPEMTAIVGINDRGDLCGGYWEVFGANHAFVALRRDGKSSVVPQS